MPPSKVIAITPGDPCGIGPEIIARTFLDDLKATSMRTADEQVTRHCFVATKQWRVTCSSAVRMEVAFKSSKNVRAMISGPMPQGSPGVMAMTLDGGIRLNLDW